MNIQKKKKLLIGMLMLCGAVLLPQFASCDKTKAVKAEPESAAPADAEVSTGAAGETAAVTLAGGRAETKRPRWISGEARPPAGVLWGVGSANMSSPNMSLTMAQSRALADLARQLQKETVTVEAEGERVTRTTSEAQLTGAKTLETFHDEDGTVWVLVEYRPGARP